jgi:hypothetical protein
MGRDEEAKAELAKVEQLHAKTREDLLHKISGAPPAPGLE